MQSGKKWFLVSVALALVILGYISAGFTMRNTDIPEFCGTCHVMHEAVRTRGSTGKKPPEMKCGHTFAGSATWNNTFRRPRSAPKTR